MTPAGPERYGPEGEGPERRPPFPNKLKEIHKRFYIFETKFL